MKKKHPFLYNVIRRSIVVILLAMMVLTAYNQSTGSLVSPEGFLAKIITPVQGFVSQASQNISSYLYRVKLRSNIEYEYNQLKAQNDELTLRSILYEELEQENAQLRALLGEYPDARLNFTKSATKMGRLIWNTRFLDRVRDIGMGSFFFEGKDRPANATTQIAADGSEVYAPLNYL